mgnify:CR=1 FL=1
MRYTRECQDIYYINVPNMASAFDKQFFANLFKLYNLANHVLRDAEKEVLEGLAGRIRRWSDDMCNTTHIYFEDPDDYGRDKGTFQQYVDDVTACAERLGGTLEYSFDTRRKKNGNKINTVNITITWKFLWEWDRGDFDSSDEDEEQTNEQK